MTSISNSLPHAQVVGCHGQQHAERQARSKQQIEGVCLWHTTCRSICASLAWLQANGCMALCWSALGLHEGGCSMLGSRCGH